MTGEVLLADTLVSPLPETAAYLRGEPYEVPNRVVQDRLAYLFDVGRLNQTGISQKQAESYFEDTVLPAMAQAYRDRNATLDNRGKLTDEALASKLELCSTQVRYRLQGRELGEISTMTGHAVSTVKQNLADAFKVLNGGWSRFTPEYFMGAFLERFEGAVLVEQLPAQAKRLADRRVLQAARLATAESVQREPAQGTDSAGVAAQARAKKQPSASAPVDNLDETVVGESAVKTYLNSIGERDLTHLHFSPLPN